MADYEKEKIGEVGTCDIIKRYHQGVMPFREYVCKECGMVFSNKQKAREHKCK